MYVPRQSTFWVFEPFINGSPMNELICKCTSCFKLYLWGPHVCIAYWDFICIQPSFFFFLLEYTLQRSSISENLVIDSLIVIHWKNFYFAERHFHWVHISSLTVIFSQPSEDVIPLHLSAHCPCWGISCLSNCGLFTSFVYSGYFTESPLYLCCSLVSIQKI